MTKLSKFSTFNFLTLGLASAAIGLMSAQSATAATFDLVFTKLSDLTGGTPQGTAIYRADLSDVGFDISSLSITDNSNGFGGSPGRFSGFDLDAIKLSSTLVSSAADVNGIAGLNVFDFSPAGTVFTPGSQRLPTDPALIGSSDGNIDNSFATLENFDANSTTGATAFGFASLGDGGKVGFNFTNPVSTTSPLYLYFGEVGDNGEVANGQITVSDDPIQVPEPSVTIAALTLGIYFLARRNKKARTV